MGAEVSSGLDGLCTPTMVKNSGTMCCGATKDRSYEIEYEVGKSALSSFRLRVLIGFLQAGVGVIVAYQPHQPIAVEKVITGGPIDLQIPGQVRT